MVFGQRGLHFVLVASTDSADANEPIERGASTIVDLPSHGRMFRTARRVSIDDATPTGRMECDAIARFLQDGGNDDTDDADLGEFGLAWVARKALIEVHQAPEARELIDIATWCSGTGRRWAERSTRLSGDRGGHVEAAVVWIHIDPTSGRPTSWGDSFADNYLEATQGRRIDAKLRHVTDIPEGATSQPWRFRVTDMDGFGHVNNAAYLALAEEVWGSTTLVNSSRIEIEWRKPSVASEELVLWVEGEQLWLAEPTSGDLRVTVTCKPLATNG